LSALFKKYDGNTFTEEIVKGKDGVDKVLKKKYKITKLPAYLVLHMKRFSKNAFFTEKNPTIVNFPIKQMDLTEHVHDTNKKYIYDLVGNVIHDGKAGTGSYRVQTIHEPT